MENTGIQKLIITKFVLLLPVYMKVNIMFGLVDYLLEQEIKIRIDQRNKLYKKRGAFPTNTGSVPLLLRNHKT